MLLGVIQCWWGGADAGERGESGEATSQGGERGWDLGFRGRSWV